MGPATETFVGEGAAEANTHLAREAAEAVRLQLRRLISQAPIARSVVARRTR